MNIVLVSGRQPSGAPQWADALGLCIAADLAAGQHRVRWLRAAYAGIPAAPAGITEHRIHGRAPSFRKVGARLVDRAAERLLAHELRDDVPDVVHALGHGGAASAMVPWIAERMGVPPLVTADVREVLCHRGTLIDERGLVCTSWDLPQRCTVCCAAPFTGGLSPLQARLARCLRWLGDRSPFARELAFTNRLDLVLSGLQAAALVLVADAAQQQALARAGIPQGQLRVLPLREHTCERLLPLYREAMARRADPLQPPSRAAAHPSDHE